jgi:hypothetical protein
MSFTFPNYHKTQEQRIERWALMEAAQTEDQWLWPFTSWMENNYWVPTLASVLYLAFIFFGTRYMKNRKEFQLQTPLVIWNGLLAGKNLFCFILRFTSYIYSLKIRTPLSSL